MDCSDPLLRSEQVHLLKVGAEAGALPKARGPLLSSLVLAEFILCCCWPGAALTPCSCCSCLMGRGPWALYSRGVCQQEGLVM